MSVVIILRMTHNKLIRIITKDVFIMIMDNLAGANLNLILKYEHNLLKINNKLDGCLGFAFCSYLPLISAFSVLGTIIFPEGKCSQ